MIVSHLIKSMKFTTDTLCRLIGSGATALHFSCIAGDLKTVKLLVDCDPLAQMVDNIIALLQNSWCVSGDTALHVACRYGDPKIVRFLLTTKHKKALKVFNNHNELPIHLACHTEEMLKNFVVYKSNFDCNSQNIHGNTILHIACGEPNIKYYEKGEVTIVALLLYEFQCKACIPNNRNELPLYIACQYRNISLDLIKILSAGLSNDQISSQNDDGNTPLHLLLSNASIYVHHEKELHDQVNFSLTKYQHWLIFVTIIDNNQFIWHVIIMGS